MSRCGAQAEPLQSRQDGFGKIWQFCEIIDKVECQAIETHRMQLMERLGIRDVAGLVRYAIRVGLVTSDG